MLTIKLLNTKVIQHFFETLYKDKIQEYNLVILQDRQSTPRPTDSEGNLLTYLYYRVESPRTPQWQTVEKVQIGDNFVQRTITQKQLHIRVNFLGKNAANAATYFDHAINSVYAYEALRPTIEGSIVEFQYNGHSEPVDLTEIELSKWVSRIEYEILLGYIDTEDFPLDVFDNVEVTEYIQEAGVPIKPIIIKPKNEV